MGELRREPGDAVDDRVAGAGPLDAQRAQAGPPGGGARPDDRLRRPAADRIAERQSVEERFHQIDTRYSRRHSSKSASAKSRSPFERPRFCPSISASTAPRSKMLSALRSTDVMASPHSPENQRARGMEKPCLRSTSKPGGSTRRANLRSRILRSPRRAFSRAATGPTASSMMRRSRNGARTRSEEHKSELQSRGL